MRIIKDFTNYKPAHGDIIHENQADQLDEAKCPQCGEPLKFDFQRDFDRGNHWDATCCGKTYRAWDVFRLTVETR
jgi:hypothetical protein